MTNETIFKYNVANIGKHPKKTVFIQAEIWKMSVLKTLKHLLNSVDHKIVIVKPDHSTILIKVYTNSSVVSTVMLPAGSDVL